MTRIPFDPDAIRALAAVLNETGLTEIEIAEKDRRIRIVRAANPTMVAAAPAGPLAVAPQITASAPDEASHPGAVISPMVGVAYLSPEPGAPPFVTVGQSVAGGQQHAGGIRRSSADPGMIGCFRRFSSPIVARSRSVSSGPAAS